MNYEMRKKIMAKIEKRYNRDVILFFNGSGANKDEGINRGMERVMERVLLTKKRKGLILIIETAGGSENATIGLIRRISNAYEKVTAIVYDRAKSAGTLMALAADKILMSLNAQLGPIDTQSVSVVKTIEDSNFPLEEVGTILESKSLLNHEKYNEEMLHIALFEMCKKNTKKNIYPIIEKHVGAKKRDQVYKELTTRGNHGSPIFYEEAQRIGLNVELMNPHLENLIRELVFSAQDELKEFEQVGTENIIGNYLLNKRKNKENSVSDSNSKKDEVCTNKYSLIESPRKAFVNSVDVILDVASEVGDKLKTILVRAGWIEE